MSGNIISTNELIKYKNYNNIYSICLAYGGFTTMLATNSYLVLGTKLGILLIFNYMEFLQLTLVPSLHSNKDQSQDDGTPSINPKLHSSWLKNGSVEKIIMSQDGTYLAACYSNGNVFLWNLNDSNKIDFQKDNSDNNLPDTSTLATPKFLFAVLNINNHMNSTIVGFDFIDNRHTGLIISDTNGNIIYHNGYRSTFWSLSYHSNKLLLLPRSEILICTKLNEMDGNFLAVLTNSNLTLLNLKPKLNLIYQHDIEHFAPDNNILLKQHSLCWFKNNLLLSITNKIMVFYNIFNLHGMTDSIKINNFDYELNEPILSAQWINLDLIACLTVSHKFIILHVINNFEKIIVIDLLPFNLLIPPNKFVVWFNKKLILLSNYSLIIGEFVTWTSLTLNKVQTGKYIEALNLLNFIMDPNFAYPNLINLSHSIIKRKLQLMEPFNNLIFATLKYLINNNKVNDFELVISISVNLQKDWYPNDHIPRINNFLDIIWDSISNDDDTNKKSNVSSHGSITDNANDNGTNESIILTSTAPNSTTTFQGSTNVPTSNDQLIDIFLNTILNLIKLGNITSIPIVLFQELIKRFPEQLSTLVFNLPVDNWDHDLLIHLCQKFSYLDILIYIWNVSFHDYSTPLVDFIQLIRDKELINSEIFHCINLDDVITTKNCDLTDHVYDNDTLLIFDYLNSVFQDKQFPTDKLNIVIDANQVKLRLSSILFSGVDILWPLGTKEKLFTKFDNNEPIYPYVTLFLNFNDKQFLNLIDQILESSFFNDNEDIDSMGRHGTDVLMTDGDDLNVFKPNRQYIVTLLIDILKTNEMQEPVKVNIAACLAKNVPKYPQYVHISNNDIGMIISTIVDSSNLDEELHDYFENAIEAILPLYQPTQISTFLLKLKQHHFIRALFSFYKKHDDFVNILTMYFSIDDFECANHTDLKTILSLINDKINIKSPDFMKITNILKENMETLLKKVPDLKFLIQCLQKIDPSLHQEILKIGDNEKVVLAYLDELFGLYGFDNFSFEKGKLKAVYIKLVCQYRDSVELADWINKIDLTKIPVNDLISLLKKKNNIEIIALVYEKLKNFKEVILWTQLGIHGWFETNKNTLDSTAVLESPLPLIYKYLELSIKAAVNSMEDRKDNWVKIVSFLLKEFSVQKGHRCNIEICKDLMQIVFVKLTITEIGNREELWYILTCSFEQQDIILSKISDLKDLFERIFVTYHLDRSISETILQIVRNSSSDIIQIHETKLIEGWTVQNSECHVCGKKLWGAGLNPVNFLLWEAKMHNHEPNHLSGGTDKQKLCVFHCRHVFHTQCLKNMGQKKSLHCLMCKNLDSTI